MTTLLTNIAELTTNDPSHTGDPIGTLHDAAVLILSLIHI